MDGGHAARFLAYFQKEINQIFLYFCAHIKQTTTMDNYLITIFC